MEKHPNADSLSVVTVFGGYTYCARTEDWVGVTKAVYIPPDSIVKTTRPEFAFLCDGKKDTHRVKAKKLRGIVSFGLMVPAPDDAIIGDDWAEKLEIEHYDPPTEEDKIWKSKGAVMGIDSCKGPDILVPKYDLDNLRRYKDLFIEGEPCYVTEKIHGCNSRYTYINGEFYCGSRQEWRSEFQNTGHITMDYLLGHGVDEERAKGIVSRLTSGEKKSNTFWQILRQNESIQNLTKNNPGLILYGEIYGWIQDLRYGHNQGKFSFAAFDMMEDGHWLEPKEFLGKCVQYDIPTVHIFNELVTKSFIVPIKFNFKELCELSDGPTFMSKSESPHIREGIVIQPLKNRWDPTIGRVKLKLVSGTYLEKSK